MALSGSRQSRIAYVFQGANLLPYFTAYENVAFAAHVAGGDRPRDAAAPAILELVGLGAKLDHLPAELSGGEAQRVSIARALAQSPQLLLCDEPTGHLDSDTAERVLDLLDALQREFGFAWCSPRTTPTSPRGSRDSSSSKTEGSPPAASIERRRASRPPRDRPRTGAVDRPGARSRRRGQPARSDGAVRRQLAAHDDRERDPECTARLAGPRLVRGTGAAGRVGRATQAGILQASAVATAPFESAGHRASAGSIRTGGGSILAVPDDYLGHIRTFRFLHGSLRSGEIVLDQQLAATLQARVGDRVRLTRRPVHPAALPRQRRGARDRAGRALSAAQPTPRPGAGATAGPDCDSAAADVRPDDGAGAAVASAGVDRQLGGAGRSSGIQWQVQAQVAPSSLGSRPSSALRLSGHIRNRVERTLPGQVQFVDNLADSLNTAAGDALYAETLYIMLAVPGALIALGLAYLAALGTVESDRRDLARFRARGASRRELLALAAAESLVIGLVAGLLGAGGAFLAVSRLVSGGVGLTAGRGLATVGICVVVAAAGAFAARLGSGLAAMRGTVSEGRRSVQRERRPLWQRLYLDLIALAASGLIYWLTVRTGFSAVINPDSNPTLSLSVYMFFAPALLWLGATLLLVRLRGRIVAALAGRGAGSRPTAMRGFLLASAGRRGPAINRGLVVVGLLLTFGVNLGLFTATYDQQARVDAQLTLGADVVVTAPPGIAARRNLAARIARAPGVVATSAVDHSYAYVGPDLQDTFGIDPESLVRTTTLRDSYFVGGSAKTMLDRLRARPDGILVSKETITDYSLRPGDLLKLRVLDRATGRFRVVPFHVVGAVQEFPSAPKDSFMVANIAYLQRVAHDPGPNVVFVKTSGDVGAAAAATIARTTRSDGTLVKNIRDQAQQTVSSITTVDLTGISRIEEAFAVVLAASAMAMFVALGLGERRHEFATMAALGASLREIAAFLWTEAALVLAAGLLLAAGLGWLLAEMLVAMLQHVFDPPPDHLAVPWTFLAGLGAAAVGASVVASALAVRAIGRLKLGAILREQ